MTSKHWCIPLLCFLSLNVLADALLFDESLKVIEMQMQADKKICDKEKNPMRGINCIKDIRDRAKLSGKMRGTELYAEKTYYSLDTDALFKKRAELLELHDQAHELADYNPRVNPRPPGELTQEDLGVEIGTIEKELGRRGRRLDQRNREKLKRMEEATRK